MLLSDYRGGHICVVSTRNRRDVSAKSLQAGRPTREGECYSIVRSSVSKGSSRSEGPSCMCDEKGRRASGEERGGA